MDVKQGTLLALLLPLLKPLCGECSKVLSGALYEEKKTKNFLKNNTGDVSLKDGSLIGLSKIRRSGPVVMDWQDGAVKILAGLSVPGLLAPFTGQAHVKDMSVNPDIKTRVENVGVDFGVEVPVTGGSWMADYDLKLGAVDVDFEGGNLGMLSELVDLISPKVSDIVGSKIKEIMEGDVKDMIVKEFTERIPDIKSIVT